jgi:hypothetical protein
VTALLTALLALACSTAKVQDLEVAQAGPLPKPPVTLVYDFAVDPQDVDVDRWGLNDVRSEAPTEDQRNLGEAISHLFTEKLVADLEARGIKARRGVATTPVPRNAVQIEGVFLTLSEGDKAKRSTVGLGWGGSKAEARVQAYQKTAGGRRLLGEGSVATQASRKPGVVSGLARGSYMGLAFKVAETGARQAGAPDPTPERIKAMRSGLDNDIRRAAHAVGERIETEYKKQGWL